MYSVNFLENFKQMLRLLEFQSASEIFGNKILKVFLIQVYYTKLEQKKYGLIFRS